MQVNNLILQTEVKYTNPTAVQVKNLRIYNLHIHEVQAGPYSIETPLDFN